MEFMKVLKKIIKKLMTSCVRTIPEVWKVLEIVTDTVVVVFGAEDLRGLLYVKNRRAYE